MFTAVLVLAIMIIPITASISRDLFLQVPVDVKEGAVGLGLTRWEMVRGVILPYTRGGLISAVLLGAGRALGEAIAVTQVIGTTAHLTANLFDTGDTLASRIAAQYQAAASNLQIASLFYLGVILLVISLIVNFAALLDRSPIRDHSEGLTWTVSATTPAISLRATGKSRRRKQVNRVAEGISSLAAFSAVADPRTRRDLRLRAWRQGAQPRLLHQEPGDVRRDRRGHRERTCRYGDHGGDRHRHHVAGRHPRRGVRRGVRVGRASRASSDWRSTFSTAHHRLSSASSPTRCWSSAPATRRGRARPRLPS